MENNNSKYLKYAIGEIFLVVIGILIALQINNWNETNKNKTTEIDYLSELLEDYKINLLKSEKTINNIENTLPKLINLLEQSALPLPTLPIDSLNAYCALLNSMPAYISTDRTYNNLIGSGDFKLIKSTGLKSEIAEYYKYVDLIKLVQSTHEMDLVTSFQPYIIKNLDYQAVPWLRVDDFSLPQPLDNNRIMNILNDREFRNIITLKIQILTDLLDINRTINEINKRVIDLLKNDT